VKRTTLSLSKVQKLSVVKVARLRGNVIRTSPFGR